MLVELAAVARAPPSGPPSAACAGDAEAEEQADERLVGLERRPAAAVVEVAGRARARVEERAEPVAALGRRRRRHPVAVEERVADEEVGALLERQVARRLAEGVGGRVEHRRLAAGERIAALGRRGVGVGARASARRASPSTGRAVGGRRRRGAGVSVAAARRSSIPARSTPRDPTCSRIDAGQLTAASC